MIKLPVYSPLLAKRKHASALLRMTKEQNQQHAALRSLNVLRQYLVPWREALERERLFEFY